MVMDTRTRLEMGASATIAADLDHVSRRYGDVTALDDVSFSLGVGETVGLLGTNGAGKSTAIAIMLGLLHPDSGAVRVLGRAPADAVAAGEIGVMLQRGAIPTDGTVGETIEVIRRQYPNPLSLADILARTGLDDLRDRRIGGLSGGQVQRVRFAIAIAGDPRLIFLDEPTTGMDIQSRQAFWDGMRAIAEAGRTILFATHYLEEADAMADRLVVLHQGRVVADGPTTAIRARAGGRSIRFTLPGADTTVLGRLTGVTGVERHGDVVTISSSDPDATVRALYRTDLPLHDLEVMSVGLEQAFLDLTR